MIACSRRQMIAGASAAAVTAAFSGGPRRAVAADAPSVLRATTRILDIKGQPATVLGLLRENGNQGVVLEPGERFALRLRNDLTEPTIIHWHGQIPPVVQDGVANLPLPLLRAGEARDFNYAPYPGTHWMHAHVPDQEMRQLSAPLIVRTEEDARADRQEVVILLRDFSFTPLAELLVRLAEPESVPAASPPAGMAGMPMTAMPMDLNDIDFDAYLTNDRTLDDPEIVRVAPGGQVLLRVINAAAATVFRIHTGAIEGTLVAVDGQPIVPVSGQGFALAMGQRADLLLRIPAAGGVFPVLALREGAQEQTGLILATAGAVIRRLPTIGTEDAAPYQSAQEAALSALRPLPAKRVDRRLEAMLAGTMQPYVWSIDGRPWGRHLPMVTKQGERVEIAISNPTMMAHPMHLHGHHFQVVEVDGRRIAGPVRDTVQVPAMGRITIAFDAGEPVRWVFHCHHMPHLAAGMMTELAVGA